MPRYFFNIMDGRPLAARAPFTVDAIVIRPNHLHAVLTLPVDGGKGATAANPNARASPGQPPDAGAVRTYRGLSQSRPRGRRCSGAAAIAPP
jgi:hypothetical protein